MPPPPPAAAGHDRERGDARRGATQDRTQCRHRQLLVERLRFGAQELPVYAGRIEKGSGRDDVDQKATDTPATSADARPP